MRGIETMQHMGTHRAEQQGQAGFSLIELMVVIAIIGILATTVTLSLLRRSAEAKKTKVQADFNVLREAITLYRVDTGQYPNQLEDLVREPGGVNNWKGYIDGGEVPADPWGNEYTFEQPSSNSYGYEIASYGADGSPGGTDENEDLFMSRLLSTRRDNR